MVRKAARRRVEAGEASTYADAAGQFFAAAAMAREFEYWNAAGLLLVHGSIAFTDALTIRLKSVKSASENHQDAIALLGEVTAGIRGREEAMAHLERILHEKNRVAYSGASFRREDVRRLAAHADRFRAFADRILRA